MACGENGLAVESFWSLSYAELRLYLEGCILRRRSDAKVSLEHHAWLAATIINFTHVLKDDPISPAMLLGRKVRRKSQKSKEQLFDESVDKRRIRGTSPGKNTFSMMGGRRVR